MPTNVYADLVNRLQDRLTAEKAALVVDHVFGGPADQNTSGIAAYLEIRIPTEEMPERWSATSQLKDGDRFLVDVGCIVQAKDGDRPWGTPSSQGCLTLAGSVADLIEQERGRYVMDAQGIGIAGCIDMMVSMPFRFEGLGDRQYIAVVRVTFRVRFAAGNRSR